MLEFKTNQLKSRRKVLIDDHEYVVRRLGNIERLDISQYMRRLNVLEQVEKDNNNELSPEEIQEVEQISAKMTSIFVGLFDDGGDQTKSRALIASLSSDELTLLLAQIFEDKNEQTEVS